MQTSMNTSMNTAIDHSRQFMLLLVAGGMIIGAERWRRSLGAIPSFALYGALHSTTLVIALRAPWPASRKAAFVAISACLAALSVLTALNLNRYLVTPWGVAAPAVPLTLSSALGAAGYALLIRVFWIPALPRKASICISLCCAVATLAALPSGMYLHILRGWWFAIIWWSAFSLALWYFDAFFGIKLAMTADAS